MTIMACRLEKRFSQIELYAIACPRLRQASTVRYWERVR